MQENYRTKNKIEKLKKFPLIIFIKYLDYKFRPFSNMNYFPNPYFPLFYQQPYLENQVSPFPESSH